MATRCSQASALQAYGVLTAIHFVMNGHGVHRLASGGPRPGLAAAFSNDWGRPQPMQSKGDL